MTAYVATLELPMSESVWACDVVPMLTANALCPVPDSSVPKGAHLQRVSTKEGPAKFEALTEEDAAAVCGCWEERGLSPIRAELTADEWMPYIEAFNDAPGRPQGVNWFLAVDRPHDPNAAQRVSNAITRAAHKEELQKLIRNGTVPAFVADVMTPLTERHPIDRAVLARDGLKAFCDHLRIELLDAQPTFHLPARPMGVPAELLKLDSSKLVTLTSKNGPFEGTSTGPARDVIERFRAIMHRQSRDRFELSEAAQVVADMQGTDGKQLFDAMEKSAGEGELVIHDSATEKPILSNELGISARLPWHYVSPAGVDAMLTKWRASYRFPVTSGAALANGGGVGIVELECREKVTTIRDGNVIEALRKRGIDPLKMPTPPSGNKPWPLRLDIQNDLNITAAQAKQSFTRLRNDGRMKSA
jgi:hypothetical protein